MAVEGLASRRVGHCPPRVPAQSPSGFAFPPIEQKSGDSLPEFYSVQISMKYLYFVAAQAASAHTRAFWSFTRGIEREVILEL